MEEITLRESTDSDEFFVNNLTKLVMSEYVEKTWHEVKDQEYYYELNKFNSLCTKIIQYKGVDIGRISITKNNNVVKLDEIHILPEYQGKKIGSSLIKSLLRDSLVPVELSVLTNNPAKELYQRLGFEKYGNNDFRWQMRATPPQPIRGELLTSCVEKGVDFDRFVKKMEMFTAVSKTILQLSAASLAASIVFIDKFQNGSFNSVSFLLVLIWLFMGAAIIASAWYQYLAVKCIEYRFNLGHTINKFYASSLVENPGIIFGAAMVCFLLGIICFVLFIMINV